MSRTGGPVPVFFSYAHKDEELRNELANHLVMLEREGSISEWHDRRINPGQEWGGQIDTYLEAAHVILLLVSSDFLASRYCYDIEVEAAMRRHEAGEARVVPVILRPCDWSGAPFGKLQALPRNAEPVTLWPNRDQAFLDVAQGIRRVAEEMAAAAAPAPAAPAPQKSAVSSTVPRSPAIGFVSRRDDQGRNILDRLQEELSPERGQLVALWGPGGSGKTTLAAEAARHLSGAFPGRVVWTSALGRAEFTISTLLDDIATQLGHPEVRQKGIDEKEAQVRALLGSVPTLVILDNFEAISRGGDSDEQAKCLEFLSSCTECPALLTTRDLIDRPDVVNVQLAAMEDDEARDFLNRLIDRSARPKAFAGLNRDELIRECEANALVMQWVVRRVALARRVRDVLADLKRGQGDAAERVFDRSFALPQVGEDGRATLLALSLFAPDASREALAHVSGFGDDLRRLDGAIENLSALWLMEATEGHERLFLRGLTRELTRSRLLRDERAADFHARFISYFVDYAEAYSGALPEYYDALEAEKDNLLSASELAFARNDWKSVKRFAYVCGLPVSGVLAVRGFWDEAIKLNERALQAARAADQPRLVGDFSHNLGALQRMRGEWAEATRLFNESLEIYTRLGVERGLSLTLHSLGMVAEETNDFDQARELYQQSLDISRKTGNKRGIANTVHHLAILAYNSGDLDEARILYQESLDIEEELDNQGGIAASLHELARLAFKNGNLDEAQELYQKSLGIYKKLGDQHGISISLHELGRLAHTREDFQAARSFFSDSLAIKRRLRDRIGEVPSLRRLAVLDAQDGNLESAVARLKQVEEIMLHIGDDEMLAEIRKERERFETSLRSSETGLHAPSADLLQTDQQQ